MNKYLGFDVSDFSFLLNVTEVIEVFDALASPEPINQVMAGNDAEVYWRGKLAKKLHFGELLEADTTHKSCCYIVCKNAVDTGLYILQVDAIHAMHEFDNTLFKPLRINNTRLNMISDQVWIDASGERVSFLLKDVARLFFC